MQRKRCPTCKQLLPAEARPPKVRICGRCHKPIERHHKYTFKYTGRGTYIQHRYCDNPFEYGPKK